MRTRFAAAAVLFTIILASAAFAATDATRTVTAVVTDRSGNRIHGLTAADFIVTENGVTRSVASVAETTRDAGAADAALPRNIAVILDSTSLSLAGRKQSVAAIRSFIDARVRPIDHVTVIGITATGSAETLAPWTADRAVLNAALTAFEGESLNSRADRTEAENEIRQLMITDQQFTNNGTGSLITFDTLMGSARKYAALVATETRRNAESIDRALSILGAGQGRHIAILAGGGLSTRPGSDVFEYLESVKAAAEAGQTGPGVARGSRLVNPRAELSRYETTTVIREVAQRAMARGVTIYTLAPDVNSSTQLAVERTQASNNSADFAGVADLMSGYLILATRTGGQAFMGSTGTQSLARIGDDLDSHYTLTYQQPVGFADQLPDLDVKTKQNYRVRATFTAGVASKEMEVEEAVIANQKADPSSNDLHIALSKDDPVQDGKNRRVRLQVLIPVKSLKLVQEGDSVIGGFAVFVSMGDSQGNAGPVNRQTRDIKWPAATVEQMEEKTIGFVVEVIMPPGRDQISVGVLDKQSKQTGFAKTSI